MNVTIVKTDGQQRRWVLELGDDEASSLITQCLSPLAPATANRVIDAPVAHLEGLRKALQDAFPGRQDALALALEMLKAARVADDEKTR